MAVSSLHVLSQGPVIGALGRTVAVSLERRLRGGRGDGHAPVVPGPELVRRVRPLPERLIEDYVRYVGGDPRAYRGQVPPHLFPQWCMPLLARCLEPLPYPLLRAVNGGCTVRVHAPLPAAEPLDVRARLTRIEDDGQRAVLHIAVVTGTAATPSALEVAFQTVVPLSRPAGGEGAKKPRPHVPEDAREVQRIRLSRDAGLSFAKLTGDFNPIHWLPAYARASGFSDVILHGFGTLAFAWEALHRGVFAGDVRAIAEISCRLTRPLVLPREVGVYVHAGDLFVADAPGGPAYLSGAYRARGEMP